MGQQNQYALVIMTNNDVYYVTQQTAKELKVMILNRQSVGHPLTFYETIDAKNGTSVSIATGHISSIVVPKEDN